MCMCMCVRDRLSERVFNDNEQFFRYIMVDATFNNISVIRWRLALLVEETAGPGENHRPVT